MNKKARNSDITNRNNGGFVEIGADYAKFFTQLLRWIAE